MERKIKYEIVRMLIPVIGTWWLIKRILPDLGEITWWDTSNKAIPVILKLVVYQALCWILLRGVFYKIYLYYGNTLNF